MLDQNINNITCKSRITNIDQQTLEQNFFT